MAAAHTVSKIATDAQKAIYMAVAHLVEVFVRAGSLHNLQSLDAGHHGEWVAAKGARLVEGADGNHFDHDVLVVAAGAEWKPATDALSNGGDVRLDAVVTLGACVRKTEACHDFIEAQKGTRCRDDVAQTLD